MQEILFEWVVVCGKEKFYLTENQYGALINGQNNKFVAFENFTINPAYVSSCYKQKARELKKIYPCGICGATGRVFSSKGQNFSEDICENCNGSGVDTSKPSSVLRLEDE